MWLVVAAVSAALWLWLWLRWRHVRDYWRARGVPHAPPHPLLGSLGFVMKQNPALWMRENYTRFKSPYVGVWVGWRPTLVVNCPRLTRNVLVADSDVFRERLTRASSSDPMGQNLFVAREPLASSIRKRLSAAFTSAKLRANQNLMSRKSKELVQRIQQGNTKNEFMDLREMYSDYSTDVIGIAAFGVNSEATLEGDSVMRRVTQKILHITPLKGLELFIIMFFPRLSDFLRCKFFNLQIVNYFRKIFRMAVEQRGGYDNYRKETLDLLDALVHMKKDAAKDGEDLSEDLIISQAVTFLFGGFDTTASALTFASYELAFASKIQDKLYQEILKVKEKFGVLDASNLSEVNYLNCVINETVRKYPVIGWLERVASRDYNVDDALTIEAGTPVFVNMYGLHYDPDIYPEPNTFRPERFQELDAEGKQPLLLAFGDGPRHCMGKRFAQQSLRQALAEVLLAYELRPLPGCPRPDDVPIDKRSVFLIPGISLSVQFVKRHQ